MGSLLLSLGSYVTAFGFAAALWPHEAHADQLTAARTHLKHVIIVMQENRSFDQYFGTFPGADGIPAGTCVPIDPKNATAGCIVPSHNTNLAHCGGPHDSKSAATAIDGGKMDGFIAAAAASPVGCGVTNQAYLVDYHNDADIPNYWFYARTFMLQDHLFESVSNWSLPAHLQMVSGWTAVCSNPQDPLSCKTAQHIVGPKPNTNAWTPLVWMLDQQKVSWKYYLGQGAEPDCDAAEQTCDPKLMNNKVPSIWNPLPSFTTFAAATVADPHYADHVTAFDTYLSDLKKGTLPQVSWIVPDLTVGEHPPENISNGMNYVTTIVNALAASPYAADTVIFISWDDWGGFYDHVSPPIATTIPGSRYTTYGWGIRVPGIVISPWVKAATIDHQYLSFDNYNRLIEDLFLSGQRLDPATDGRPDSRPSVTEAVTTAIDPLTHASITVGNLLNEFDFTQAPKSIPIVNLVK